VDEERLRMIRNSFNYHRDFMNRKPELLDLNGEDDALVPHELALSIIMELYENLASHPIRTAETFRNAALGNGMFAVNPLLKIDEKVQVNFLMGVLRRTIREGRMIDFGFIPNTVIKDTSYGTREVFSSGELLHPYKDWLGISAWEGGMCGYYFSPFPNKPNQLLCIELYGVSPPNRPDTIMVNDIVSLEIMPNAEDVRISPWQMVDGMRETEKDLKDRGANLLDPLVCFLRMLSDASIPVVDRPAPEKLNRKRIAQGKFPIPAHTRVETRDYVSMLQGRYGRPLDRTAPHGHHASPVAHWRRAHQRHLPTGRVVPVRSSKVNWREVEEIHRLFYRVPHETEVQNTPS
jgi:hypothetical protein